MSMKNCNDTIGNPTRNLPVCKAVSGPTAPPGDPDIKNRRLHFSVRAYLRLCVCVCVCVCEREREREICCRLSHIAMSTVNFKSNCNNRSLTVTLQRTIHLCRGLKPAASDRQLILQDPLTGLLAVTQCGPRLTGQDSLFHVLIAIGRKQQKSSHVILFESGTRGLQTGH